MLMRMIFTLTAAVLLLCACDEKPKNPVAVQGERMTGAYFRAKDAGEEANLDAIKKSLDAYRALNDKFPQDLNEIKPLLSAPDLDLSKYDYNPADGSVSIKQ